ncbi:hypothetical protein ADL04_26550 [Streptomyces sp. NRRL B-3648]|nr:hypothetical protein ADL04_26550 [Streptomyces sp. NRRL B-3648]
MIALGCGCGDRGGSQLAAVTETFPDDLAEALPRARTHTVEPLQEWKDDHRSPLGLQGSGVWVRLARHDFGLADGSTHSLWEVSDGWWDYGEDADAGATTTVSLSADRARPTGARPGTPTADLHR